MLELSALGLLQREPLHGYRLKQELELFMGSCMSVNYGAIYPLLHRLEERGFIQCSIEESPESGGERKIYSITLEGKQRWKTLMRQQSRDSWMKSRCRFMVKFFFFSDIEPDLRLELLNCRLHACHSRKDYVHQQDFSQDPYQRATWLRHLDMINEEIDWLQEQLNQETARAASSNDSSTLKQHQAV
ncbi:MAG: PadR family transcriptional regulator [Phormidium sp.]